MNRLRTPFHFPAPECSSIGLPRQYLSPSSVSQPSSRWISVVPKKLGHQETLFAAAIAATEQRINVKHRSHNFTICGNGVEFMQKIKLLQRSQTLSAY